MLWLSFVPLPEAVRIVFVDVVYVVCRLFCVPGRGKKKHWINEMMSNKWCDLSSFPLKAFVLASKWCMSCMLSLSVCSKRECAKLIEWIVFEMAYGIYLKWNILEQNDVYCKVHISGVWVQVGIVRYRWFRYLMNSCNLRVVCFNGFWFACNLLFKGTYLYVCLWSASHPCLP